MEQETTKKMILKIPIQDGQYYTLDTASEDVRQVLDWSKVKLKSSGYSIRPRAALYAPGIPDSAGSGTLFTTADAVFTGIPSHLGDSTSNSTEASVDLHHLMTHTENMVRAMILQYNIDADISDLTYTDPDVPKPGQEDWQTKGAAIGPPVASKPGWFMNLYNGYDIGKNWSGPSGATYRMSEEGTGFGRFVGWRKVS